MNENTFSFGFGDTAQKIENLSFELKVSLAIGYIVAWVVIFNIAG